MMENVDIIENIISLYFNGVSEKTLSKRHSKDTVRKAIHSECFKNIRDKYQAKKREVFINHWKEHGLSGMVGVKEE